MDLWFEWDENNEECFSTFDDSDRFDEDSLCSCDIRTRECFDELAGDGGEFLKMVAVPI